MNNNRNNRRRNLSQKKSAKIKYSFTTFILIFCLIHLSVSVFNNIHKNINFPAKIKSMEQRKAEEYNHNIKLKQEIANFNSEKSLEAIARNNLKMAGNDEILILINKEEKQDSINNKKTDI